MPNIRRITGDARAPLYSAHASRLIEQQALTTHPHFHLMSRAGESIAQLSRAIAPHARVVWVACGPGNNGGDGLVAATNLHQAAGNQVRVVATLLATPGHMPADAAHALQIAQAAGVRIVDEPPEHVDLTIDALLGLGHLRQPTGRLAAHLLRLQTTPSPVLCVDLPSGLNADSGRHWAGPLRHPPPGVRHTLALMTLKPGLFTADGRDQAGAVWLDDLGVNPEASLQPPTATLWGEPPTLMTRAHATHKGSRGDVLVIGGQDASFDGTGMIGAALLAARGALHAGAGRVYLSLLGTAGSSTSMSTDPACPELMFRQWQAVAAGSLLEESVVVCGCGGGQAVNNVIPTVIQRANTLVLDADGLNGVATDPFLQEALQQRHSRAQLTVLTPHPLEAARLLGISTTEVMSDRLTATQHLSDRFAAVCILKGSGTVICAPGETPFINASGNASLATAGTGDVLAGMVGAALAGADEAAPPLFAILRAVHHHGWLADQWVRNASTSRYGSRQLTANALATASAPP